MSKLTGREKNTHTQTKYTEDNRRSGNTADTNQNNDTVGEVKLKHEHARHKLDNMKHDRLMLTDSM